MQQLNWTLKLLSINHLSSGFVHSFRLEFVLESTKRTNNCKPIIMIVKSDISFLRVFFNSLKTFPLNQFRSTERRKLCLRESNFKNFQWEHTAGSPPKYAPPARTLHPVLPNTTENPAHVLQKRITTERFSKDILSGAPREGQPRSSVAPYLGKCGNPPIREILVIT